MKANSTAIFSEVTAVIPSAKQPDCEAFAYRRFLLCFRQPVSRHTPSSSRRTSASRPERPHRDHGGRELQG
jgi:hypothetical protein